jgi:hypothetical protein
MSLIDLGFTYDEAQQEAKSSFSDLPDGTYNTQVVKWDNKQSAAGNDYILFHLQILNNPELQNRRLFYRVMKDGSPMAKRRLIELVNGCGGSWTGTQFDPETLMGATVNAKQVTKDGNTNIYIVK